MTTLLGFGTSTKLDSSTAGREAALNALYRLGKNEPEIIIAFISTIFDQKEVIKAIRSVIRETPLIGCSSPATITTQGAFRDSVSVFTISSSSISFSYGAGSHIDKNARLASHDATKLALGASKETTKVYMMFSDGLLANGTDLLRGAQEVLGTSFPIIGGAAIDNLAFQKTYQYLNNTIYTNSIVGLLVNGDVSIGVGEASSWQPVGSPRKITKASSNIIKEIDRRKASEIYEDYFEKTLDELNKVGIANIGISYPLGIQSRLKKEYLTRLPIALGQDGSLILNAEIPEGKDVNIMIGDKNIALQATRKACLEALEGIKRTEIKFAVVFSDIARLKLLRADAKKEIETIKDILPDNIPLMGCYTCGEFGESHFNNHAISIVVFSETDRKLAI